MRSTYESGPLQGGGLVLRIQSLTPDHGLFHQEHLEYGVNPDPFPLLPVRVVKFYQGLQKKQEIYPLNKHKKQSSTFTHQWKSFLIMQTMIIDI